jgi:hypothetical protein
MLGVALATAPTSALAEVQVRGTPEAVSIEANNTSVKDILSSLGTAFDVHYRSSVNLEKQLTGTYEGSLPRVMKRILNGYSFVVKTGDGGVEVTVIGISTAGFATGALAASRVAAQTPQVVPTRLLPAIEAAGPSTVPDPPPPPAIAAVEPPVQAASKATHSFRRLLRDHPVVVGEQGTRPSPPRQTKMAGRTSRRSIAHVWHTRRGQASIFYADRIDQFGLTIPKSSRSWLPWGPSFCICCTRPVIFSLPNWRPRHKQRHKH